MQKGPIAVSLGLLAAALIAYGVYPHESERDRFLREAKESAARDIAKRNLDKVYQDIRLGMSARQVRRMLQGGADDTNYPHNEKVWTIGDFKDKTGRILRVYFDREEKVVNYELIPQDRAAPWSPDS